MSTALSPYIHREVPLEFAGRRLTFATSLELFSSHQVDVGTRLLLRTLEPVLLDRGARGAEGARVLDLGCGYGPLGVALAAAPGVASAHLVDRDALALDFARENARHNHVEERVAVTASLGLDDVPGDPGYDLVVSNVPGRAGDAVIASMLTGALRVLRPGGLVAVVVIEPIRELVATTLAGADLRDHVEVTLRHDTADYSVFHFRRLPDRAAPASFPAPADAFAAGTYDRGTLIFEDARGETVSISTVHGLPGYDRPDPLEIAVTRRLPEVRREMRVLVSNVGQGYLAAYLLRAQSGQPPGAGFVLVDRDLLALRTARRALIALGCPADRIETRHVGAWTGDSIGTGNIEEAGAGAGAASADLVAGVLHEGGGAAAVEGEYAGLLAALAPGGHAVLAGSSTAITRVTAHALPAGMHASRTRHRGASVLVVARG
ncbi:MAG: methyltransferase [Dehalococcoidia bacterium]